MEVKAITKYVRVQPRKVRIVADEVRGMSALYAAQKLRFHKSKGAHALHKTLVSAMANAMENHSIPAEALKIAAIVIDEGPRLKRMQARAMGRGNRIIKKTSHITVTVSETELATIVRPHGTKAKPRPTFASVKPKKGTAKAEAAVETPVEVVEETPVVETVVETPVETAEVAEVVAAEVPVAETEAVSEEKGDN